ncbi:MAG: autotransporter-associated beta strand repeat-containing protein [Limisphaerales bacterium]
MTNKPFHFLVSLALARLSAASAVAVLFCMASTTRAETFTNAGGTLSYTNPINFAEGTVPNAVGASVIFNSPLANQSASLSNSSPNGITVGSITFNNTTATTIGIFNGVAGGPLIFDQIGTGPATITTTGTGSGNNTISATMVFTDSVVANVNNTNATSTSGSLNLTGAISGPGGFTKAGDGTATFGSGLKTYTGPTVINGGRLRISNLAQPSATSSFTINNGGQLDVISSGIVTFGSGPLNLNGAGPTTGPTAAFPGAIRNDSNLQVTIVNATVLQSDTLIQVQGLNGVLVFSNAISGPGKLTLTAPNSDANQGQLVLNGANTYSGGTLVNGGNLVVTNAGTLGSGNVTIDNTNAPLSVAKLTLSPGVVNAIADTATLSLAGGGVAGVADQGFVDLGAGINEIVGGLTLAGIVRGPGTYGSTLSGATIQNNEFFAGTGIITVAVPEPSVIALAAVGGVITLLARRRKR